MFVKSFDAYPDRASNEALGLTISIWYPDGPMVELEPIGPAEYLSPGQEATFTEHSYLKEKAFPVDTSEMSFGEIQKEVDVLIGD